MKNKIQGDWWNSAIVNKPVLLEDFIKQLNLWRRSGGRPSTFVYNLDARLQLMREHGHADI